LKKVPENHCPTEWWCRVAMEENAWLHIGDVFFNAEDMRYLKVMMMTDFRMDFPESDRPKSSEAAREQEKGGAR
jgi:hypothetical protein